MTTNHTNGTNRRKEKNLNHEIHETHEMEEKKKGKMLQGSKLLAAQKILTQCGLVKAIQTAKEPLTPAVRRILLIPLRNDEVRRTDPLSKKLQSQFFGGELDLRKLRCLSVDHRMCSVLS